MIEKIPAPCVSCPFLAQDVAGAWCSMDGWRWGKVKDGEVCKPGEAIKGPLHQELPKEAKEV